MFNLGFFQKGSAILRGIMVRCGLTALPLGFVILLCCIMFGGLGRAKEHNSALMPPPEVSARISVAHAPREEDAEKPMRSHREKAGRKSSIQLAAFERMNIVHARINVPN